MIELHSLLDTVARGGGGGSGGGGSGGGGIFYLLYFIGHVPTHWLGAQFRKREKIDAGTLVVWPLAVLYAIILVVVFHFWGILMAVGAIVGAGSGLYGWFGKLSRNKKAEAGLLAAAATDPAWDVAKLTSYSASVFERFQYDWGKADTESMKNYMTPWYHYHNSLMMLALAQAKRVNNMSNVKILQQNIQSVNDAPGNGNDSFVMGFQATATDQLVDTRDQSVIYTDNSEFVEYWNFERAGETWLLSGIDQGTANVLSANESIRQFAQQNKFCYSLDWGWLLLPRTGQLFGSGKFGTSDINNHVIGTYNNVLVQIYTYTPKPKDQTPDNYLIAQVQLPKTYGNILVRHKPKWYKRIMGVKGLSKSTTEWSDFNKKFEIYTSTAEGPTSLELLHPTFMEYLESMPFEVNIEVVDNVVYFYTKQVAIDPTYYSNMLAIMQEAFKQMRM